MIKNRNLISNSPRVVQANKKNYEFTPIGGTSDRPSVINASSKSNIGPTKLTFKSSKQHQQSSSFVDDSDYDILDQADTIPRHRVVPTGSLNVPTNSHINILNEASNPVLQQQEFLERLQTENYNLRVNIAGLQKMVESVSSKDQMFLYDENSKLQKENIRLHGELKALQEELLREKHKTNNQANISDINLENETLKSKVNFLSTQVEDLKHADQENLVLKRTNQELSQHLESLKSESDTLGQELDRAYDKIDQVEDDLKNNHGDFDDLEFKLRQTEKLLQEKIHELTEKDEELKERYHELDDLRSKLNVYHSHQSQNDQVASGQVEELKALLKRRDEEYHELSKQERRLKEYKSQFEEVKSRLEESLAKERQLQNELETTMKRLDLSEKSQTDSQLSKSSAEQFITRLKSEKIELEGEINQLSSKIEHLTRINNDYERKLDEFDQVNSLVGKLKNENFGLRSRVDTLQEDLHHSTNRSEELDQQLKEQQHQYHQLSQECDRIQRAYQELKRQQHESLDQHSSLFINQEQQLNEWKNQIDHLTSQLDNLFVENRNLKSTLNQKKASENEDTKFNELLEDHRELKADYEKLSDYAKELKSSLAQYVDQMKIQLSDIEIKNLELDRLRQALQKSEDSSRQLENDVIATRQQLVRKIDILEAQAKEVKMVHDSEEKVLKEMLDSVSKSRNITSLSGLYEDLDRKYSHQKEDLERLLKVKFTQTVDLANDLDKAKLTSVQLKTEISGLQIKLESLEKENILLKNESTENKNKLEKSTELVDQLQKKLIENLELVKSVEEFSQHKSKYMEEKLEMTKELSSLKSDLKKSENEVATITKSYKDLLSKQNEITLDSAKDKKLELLECRLEISKIQLIYNVYTILDLTSMLNYTERFLHQKELELQHKKNLLEVFGIDDHDKIIECNSMKSRFKIAAYHVIAAIRIKRKALYNKPRAEKFLQLIEKEKALELEL